MKSAHVCKVSFLFIFLIMLLSLPVSAAVDSTSGSILLSHLSWSPSDTLIIRSGHIVTVDSNWSSITYDAVYVRAGGKLAFNPGRRANFNAVRAGGSSARPFSSISGGAIEMRASDTLGVANANRFDQYDFYTQGITASVDIDGGSSATKAVLLPIGSKLVSAFWNDSTQVRLVYAKSYFRGHGSWVPDNGIQIIDNYRRAFIGSSVFDSSGLNFDHTRGVIMVACTLTTYYNQIGAISFQNYNRQDTVRDCYIVCNNMNQSSGTTWSNGIVMESLDGDYINCADSLYIAHNIIHGANTTGMKGRACTEF